MIKQVLEGQTIQDTIPKLEPPFQEPVVRLENGLMFDERIFECPTAILGCVGSGKTFLLEKMMKQILESADKFQENAYIFCAKPDFLKYKRPQDVVVSVDNTGDPKGCWNLFLEMKMSSNPEQTARDIVSSILQDQQSLQNPYFVNSAKDVLFTVIMACYEEGIEKGYLPTNAYLFDFFEKVSLNPADEYSWQNLAVIKPRRFAHLIDYFGNGGLEQGYGTISEIRTLLFEALWGSFCTDNGEFSIIESLKNGCRVFLYYDHASSSNASIKIYKTLLDLLFKRITDPENKRRCWVFLDEFSILPRTEQLIDCMSLGREAGLRLICTLQSAQLLTRHYKEDEAKALLSLFPNIICLKVQDALSRAVLADRYGECLTSYTFNGPMQKVIPHTEHRPVVADYDFTMIQRKGDAVMSIPNLCDSPFFYHGYKGA